MLKQEAQAVRDKNLMSSIQSFQELCDTKWPIVQYLGHLDVDPLPPMYKYNMSKVQWKRLGIPVRSNLARTQSRTKTEQNPNDHERKQGNEHIESCSGCDEQKLITDLQLGFLLFFVFLFGCLLLFFFGGGWLVGWLYSKYEACESAAPGQIPVF